MFEVRLHGRAGQGAKLAAQLLAEAALMEGKYIQAFPEYGPERSGAPVASYLRIDKNEIRAHYPIICPDVVLVLDPSLIEISGANKGAETKTITIINTPYTKEEIKRKYQLFGSIYAIPASRFSLEIIGDNKPNFILLGLLIKLTNIVKLESLKKVIKKYFENKKMSELAKVNLTALEKGYNFVDKK